MLTKSKLEQDLDLIYCLLVLVRSQKVLETMDCIPVKTLVNILFDKVQDLRKEIEYETEKTRQPTFQKTI